MDRTVAVVLNWRRPLDTLSCVASLLACDRPLDIVVLDNASGDGSFETIWHGLASMPQISDGDATLVRIGKDEPWPVDPASHRQVLLVDTLRNGGYAYGNNVGIRLALSRPETAWIWVLNNDTLVPSAATMDALIARMIEDPSIGICGATVVYAHAPDQVQTLGGGAFRRLIGRCYPIGFGSTLTDPIDAVLVERNLCYVNGASAFVRRIFVEAVGLMNEDYFLYFEEFDWMMRGKARFRPGFASNAVVIHAVGATIGTSDFGGGSSLSSYYMTRNRLLFLWRHFPASLPGAVIDLIREAFYEARRGRWRNLASMAQAIIGRPFYS